MRQWLRKRRLKSVLRRSNDEWLHSLRSEHPDAALSDLRRVLVTGLVASLRQRGVRDAESHAEDFAQDAMLKILDHLDDFRGESRFLTWAQKIATRVAISELRTSRWRNVSLDDVTSGQDERPLSESVVTDDAAPDDRAADSIQMQIVMEVIERDLTERQRMVIEAVVINEMSIEIFAERIGSNRNAVYKLLHDARKRLRAALEERGVSVEEVLDSST